MLCASNLSKRYGDRIAVAGVSLNIAPGEIVGLLGPNGAGKTTTVAMICGLTRPDDGQVSVGGDDLNGDRPGRAKQRIGLVPQELALVDEISARANLELFGALYRVPRALLPERVDAALALVGLGERADERAGTFSGGMKRRLNIACALVHDPDVLLFDEPTVGVDAQSRNAIFDNLETLRARGKALLYTTHYMEEAERLCDRVVIVDHGRVVAADTLAGLYARLPAALTLEIRLSGTVDTAALAREAMVSQVAQRGETLHLGLSDLTLGAPAVLAWLAGRGHSVRQLGSARAGLEDVFLNLTGRDLRN